MRCLHTACCHQHPELPCLWLCFSTRPSIPYLTPLVNSIPGHNGNFSVLKHLLQLFFQVITYLVFPTSSNSSVHITLSCPVKVKVKSLSCVQLFVTLWTVACQAPLSMGYSRQEYWNGLPFPSPGNPPDPGNKPCSPTPQAVSLPSEPPGKPKTPCLSNSDSSFS